MTTYRRFALAGLAIAFLAPVSAAPQGPQASYDSVHVNGVSLAYRVMGAGEPLVLLHGFFGTGDSWSALFDVLSSSHRLIVPDLRGHGRSSNPTGTFTHRQSAADIFALLDHLGVNRFRAMGFSSGGMTLLHMATTQPNRIETMILVGATSYFPEEARRIIRANAPDSVSAERLEDYASRHGSVEKGEALIRQFNGFQNSFDDMNFTPPPSRHHSCPHANRPRRSRSLLPCSHSCRTVSGDPRFLPLGRAQRRARNTPSGPGRPTTLY